MARARNIKPSFFTNEIIGEADPLIGILFIGLWCLADREGRLEDRPRKIKAELIPYRDSVNTDEMISFLDQHGFILRYEVNGIKYIQILKFEQHQSPHHLEAPSKIPPPPGGSNRLKNTPVGVPQRRRIYDRDGHKCVVCGSIDHLTIDHITPVSKGGDSSDDNLRTLCKSCNSSKGNRAEPKAKDKQKISSSKDRDNHPHVFPSDSLIPDSLIPDSGFTDSPIGAHKDARATPRFDAMRYLMDKAVDEAVARDWLTLRKQKKAPATETAITGIEREAQKAGLSLHAALTTCCQRGWQGFKAEWIANTPQVRTIHDERKATIDALTGRNQENAERDITSESLRLA